MRETIPSRLPPLGDSRHRRSSAACSGGQLYREDVSSPSAVTFRDQHTGSRRRHASQCGGVKACQRGPPQHSHRRRHGTGALPSYPRLLRPDGPHRAP